MLHDAVTYTVDDKHNLRFETMRVEKSLPSTLDEQAPNITSETLRGTAPNERIQQDGRIDNDQSGQNAQHSLEDADYLDAVNRGT
jgi:hypothetical protein